MAEKWNESIYRPVLFQVYSLAASIGSAATVISSFYMHLEKISKSSS